VGQAAESLTVPQSELVNALVPAGFMLHPAEGAGLTGEFAEHNSNISNPNMPAFFIQNFNDVKRV